METIEQIDYSLCPRFEQAFAILGKKWNGLIIDVLLTCGPQRFVDLANKVPAVSDRVLTERLRELEEAGIVARTQLNGNTHHFCYKLTEKGIDFNQSLSAIRTWGEKWA